jgi:hypothetical protein
MVALCTTNIDVHKLRYLPTLVTSVFYEHQNKQQLFLYTQFTDRFYNRDGERLLRGMDWNVK